MWYFAHKSFVRDKPDLAKEIKRAPNLQTRLAPADPSSSFGAACPSAPQNCMGSPSLPHYTGSGLLRRSTSPNLTAISPSHANSEPLLASYASPPPCGAPYPWSFAGLHNLDATAVLLTSPSLPPAPMSAFPPYYYQPQEVANAGEALSTFRPKARPVIPPFNGPKTYVCAHPGCGMVFKKRNALEQVRSSFLDVPRGDAHGEPLRSTFRLIQERHVSTVSNCFSIYFQFTLTFP